jgi:hypothetical protein
MTRVPVDLEALNKGLQQFGLRLKNFGEGTVSVPVPDPNSSGWLTSSIIYIQDDAGKEVAVQI